MADPQKTASPSPIADPLVPVTLSPEFLSGLTNEDLRRVAYAFSEQISHFSSIQSQKQTDVNWNKNFDDARKSEEKLRVDSYTNREFRAKYRDSTINLLNEFKARSHNKDHVFLFENLMAGMTVSGMIALGNISVAGSEFIALAQDLP